MKTGTTLVSRLRHLSTHSPSRALSNSSYYSNNTAAIIVPCCTSNSSTFSRTFESNLQDFFHLLGTILLLEFIVIECRPVNRNDIYPATNKHTTSSFAKCQKSFNFVCLHIHGNKRHRTYSLNIRTVHKLTHTKMHSVSCSA